MPNTKKTRTKGRQCEGKTPYFSLGFAHRQVRRAREERGALVEVYKCKHCPAWHIGHSRPTKRKRY